MNCQQHLLEETESYLREAVAPNAMTLDRDSEALRQALKGLGDRRLLALQVPKMWGGTDAQTARRVKEAIACYSGALAFLQTQHQSAGAMLAISENESLKQAYLPHLATGDRLLGIAFSQLRRQGKPMVKALPVDGGFAIDGTVPWVTGFGSFSEFILAAELPDGRALYGILPFANTEENGGSITVSEPMQLAAMQSSNTVTCAIAGWFLPQDRVVCIRSADSIHESDKNNVLNHSFLALGCARAGLDIVEAAAIAKPLPFIQPAFEALDRELATCRAEIYQTVQQQPDSGDVEPWQRRSLQLRARAIGLANRCAQAAVTVSRGAANYAHHPAQRVYREALVFSVAGQTTAVMEATLARLVKSEE